ncbi:metallophosphoesterase [Phyllobacterium zundukense]|uniref:Metallophosphoesterase n=1 Tax=Phyllobacterium zundukense TaxID=1867719 RepID=A0ACD4CVB3_9HYPH|nr:metallophosphoesterase [Phyllobacterium zundukense]UXN57521.1 metallophosphoesterase [Phyllobacterium zundukense]
MKVVVVSDTHFIVPGEAVQGIDSNDRLQTCVKEINRLAGDADVCVVMGDLVDRPSGEAYRLFFSHFDCLKMPVQFLIGNHDDRGVFLESVPVASADANGFVQSALETDNALLLFLDTHNPGSNSGDYGPEKLQWLNSKLTSAPDKSAYIFMHHPPFRTGFFIDHSKVEHSDALLNTIHAAGNVRHIFIGHTHRAASGHWNGVTWTTLQGLVNENDFELLPGKPNYRNGPAQKGILLINGGESVLHFHDILNPYPIIAHSGRSIREPSGGPSS